jgi:hypothetical protein
MIAAIFLFLRGNRDWLVPVLIGVCVVFALWKLNDAGYERGVRETNGAWDMRVAEANMLSAQTQTAMNENQLELTTKLDLQLGLLRSFRPAIIERVTHEIRSDVRYTDTACALTDGVFSEINRARAASGSAGIISLDLGSVRKAGSPDRSATGDVGDGRLELDTGLY